MRNSFRLFLFVSASVVATGLGSASSSAQSAPSVDDVKGNIDSVKRGNTDPFAKSEQKQFGTSVGDILILPELTVGTVYNDNVFSSRTNTKGSFGVVVRPEITVKRDTGIQNTTLSASVDATKFFDVNNADTVSGTLDLKHVYEIERGFDLTYQGGIARSQDRMSAYGATNTGSGAGSVYVEPISYMTYSSALDLNKTYNDAFVSAGANVIDYMYENSRTTTGNTLVQSNRDLLEYAGHARAGLRFLSDGYAFIEPAVTQYDFKIGAPATGYTVLAGVGTDRLSLFRGEIYGGFQSVTQSGAGVGSHDLSGGKFGGRVSWTPTRDLVASLNADHSITPTTALSGSIGGLTRADTVSASVTYSYSTRVEVAGNVGYSEVSYLRTTRNDKVSEFGIGSTYYFTNSLGVRFEYAHTDVNSNQSIYNYTDNAVTLGLHVRM